MKNTPKILLTGANGFVGKYIHKELTELGCDVCTLSRSASTKGNHVQCNLTQSNMLPRFNRAFKWVIHAAGRAHLIPVKDSEKEDLFNTNVKGTKNLLQALDLSPGKPDAFIFISTVAVYGLETGELIDEETPLLATTAYGRSKILAERLINDWGERHAVKIGILRLPLIAGINPPGNLGNMINAIRKGYYFRIGRGETRRSWVWAQDVAGIIPKMAKIGGVYNLTDGYHPALAEIEDGLSQIIGKNSIISMPTIVAKVLAQLGDVAKYAGLNRIPIDSQRLNKLRHSLTFSDAKARRILKWDPAIIIGEMDKVFKEVY